MYYNPPLRPFGRSPRREVDVSTFLSSVTGRARRPDRTSYFQNWHLQNWHVQNWHLQNWHLQDWRLQSWYFQNWYIQSLRSL